MKKVSNILSMALVAGTLASTTQVAVASPEQDREVFVQYFEKRFPNVAEGDWINGVYSILPEARAQWEAMEEFPPYELDIEEGEELYNAPFATTGDIREGEGLFNKKFANGKSFSDCFPEPGVRAEYPYWDKERSEVVTLEQAINECRVSNGEKAWKWNKGPIAKVSAFMSYESRGQIINVEVPEDDPKALEAFELGKEFYFSKRGQLNFSCADCHMSGSGLKARAETLSPSLGHTSHWPVYRSKWQELGTLHRRYGGCNANIRAAKLKPQGEEYSALEYYLSYMSNGLEYNGPGSRK